MKTLATQSSSTGLTSSDRVSLNTTFQNLATQISNLQTGASVNGVNLLNSATGMTVTTGIDGDTPSNTTVAGFNISALADTVEALSLTSTSTTASILAGDTTGSAAISGTAAIDTVTINGGNSVAAGASVALNNSQGTLTFTNAASTAFVPTVGTHVSYSAGGTATPASDLVVFNALGGTGQTVTLAGLTFTASSGAGHYSDIANAFASRADGTSFSNVAVTGGTLDGTLTGYSTGTHDNEGGVRFTKTTGEGTLTKSGTGASAATISGHISYSAGSATSAADTSTFKDMTAGQTATAAGLTFTAGASGATAAQVAAAFANRVVGYTGGTVAGGVTTGTLTGYNTGAASISNGVVFTSTATSNVTLTATGGRSTESVANAMAAFINNNVNPIASTGTIAFTAASGTTNTNLSMYTASVSGTGNSAQLVLTQKSGQYIASTLTNGSNTVIANSTTGVAASAGVKSVDHVTFTALTSGQSVSVGGLTFTAASSLTKGAVAQAYFDYINSATEPASTTGAFSGTSQAAMTALYYAADSAAAAANLTGGDRTAAGLATNGIVYFGGRSVGASALTVTGGDAVANANAAVASLITQINSISTGQSAFNAASTGLSAQKTAAIALQTGLTNTVDQIQNIDATAMQAKLQQLNNQQSIDYYLVSQMNTEAAALLSIFR
jgi:hypothetical protein